MDRINLGGSARRVARRGCLLFLLAAVIAGRSQGQVPMPPAPASQLGPLLRAIGQEKYAEARKQADTIMKSGTPADRMKASLRYGRILLGLGQKQPAQQYLAMMARQNLDGDAAQLLLVYQAWLTALNGDRDAAIKTLEETLTKSMPYTSTAEAADVLAMLYMAKGDQAGAKRAVDFGLKFLQYRGIKEDYLATLLRNRLRSNIASPEAKKLYDAAEKLRAQGKYREAGQGFTELTVRFPANVWAHAAGYRIGQCLLGLNQPQQALTHWRQFIEQQPRGPWRGQARVGCTDLVLESRLDLKAALEHARAASSDLENVGEEAASSWQEVAHEIHLRHGLVSLVEGRYAAAANAFTEARMALPQKAGAKRLAEGLDRLIETAQNRGPLLPPELAVGDERGSTALSIAMVYYLLRRHDPAERFFELPLSGTARSRSEAHRSFASMGLARVTVARAKASPPGKSAASSKTPSPWQQAKALYLQSIQEHPNATWHDETLRELALLVEYVAQREAVTPEGADSKKKKAATGRARRVMPSTQTKYQQQTTALQKARAEALPHWSALVERYTTSRHLPQALFHAGVLLAEAGRNAEAVASFSRLTEEFPTSPWTGEAHVRLIDVKLEQEFDLEGAQQHVDAAIDWFEGLDRDAVADARRTLDDDETLTMRGVDRVGYDIYLRSGLLAYLQERFEQAKLWFEKAKPLAPPRNLVVVQGQIPTGIEKLMKFAQDGRSLAPQEARQGDPTARLILMLADVYLKGEEWQKSMDLCDKVIAQSTKKITREQRSWAYRQRAIAFSGLRLNTDAKAAYLAAQQTLPSASWAPKCLFLAGTIAHNYGEQPRDAIRIFEEVVRRYPTSEYASKAAYFIGVIYEWNSQWLQAKAAYSQVVRDYPESRWASAAMNFHLKKVDAALAAEKANKTDEE